MMQTSAHGLTKPPLRRTAAGFTLLELLVVLVIAGIMLGAIALNAVPGDRQVVQSEAQRVALLLQLARDEAIVRNRPIAFEADQDRYRFLIRQNDNWEMLAQDAILREREFKRRPLQLSMTPLVGDSLPGMPLRIVFGREPVDRAFVLTLALGSQSALIRADGIGHFQVE
jgi:general secretion pathway protein H